MKLRNWRIVAGILALLLVQAVLGRLDAEARLEDAELRLAAPHHAAIWASEGDINPSTSVANASRDGRGAK